jgi:hypothetical protein
MFTDRHTRAPRTPVVERVDDIDQLWAHFAAHPSPEVRVQILDLVVPESTALALSRAAGAIVVGSRLR